MHITSYNHEASIGSYRFNVFIEETRAQDVIY